MARDAPSPVLPTRVGSTCGRATRGRKATDPWSDGSARCTAPRWFAIVAARKALEMASHAFAEIRYRRAGLLVALAMILVTIVALLLKIRAVDARRAPRTDTRRSTAEQK